MAGSSLVRWVHRRAVEADVGPVLIATDSAEVADDVALDGAIVVRTGAADNGTLRVAEAARGRSEAIVLNVQGDQPLLDPAHIRCLVERMRSCAIGTLVTPYTGAPDDPAIVEAVLDGDRALDFRRMPQGIPAWRHLGLYGFTRAALDRVNSLPVSARARANGLEQLTWLDAGLEIRVATVSHAEPAVDTPEQLEQIRRHLGG